MYESRDIARRMSPRWRKVETDVPETEGSRRRAPRRRRAKTDVLETKGQDGCPRDFFFFFMPRDERCAL